MYYPNISLGNTGMKVLELAELVRRNLLEELDPDSPETRPEEGTYSIASLELDRARSRIQGNTLRDHGSRGNNLWHTALRMLCLGRVICHTRRQQPTPRSDENKSPFQNGSASNGE